MDKLINAAMFLNNRTTKGSKTQREGKHKVSPVSTGHNFDDIGRCNFKND